MVCPKFDWTRLDTKVLLTKGKMELYGFPRLRSELLLFADAELAEDEVDDVIVCGDAGERVEGVEGLVEVEQ